MYETMQSELYQLGQSILMIVALGLAFLFAPKPKTGWTKPCSK